MFTLDHLVQSLHEIRHEGEEGTLLVLIKEANASVNFNQIKTVFHYASGRFHKSLVRCAPQTNRTPRLAISLIRLLPNIFEKCAFVLI